MKPGTSIATSLTRRDFLQSTAAVDTSVAFANVTTRLLAEALPVGGPLAVPAWASIHPFVHLYAPRS